MKLAFGVWGAEAADAEAVAGPEATGASSVFMRRYVEGLQSNPAG